MSTIKAPYFLILFLTALIFSPLDIKAGNAVFPKNEPDLYLYNAQILNLNNSSENENKFQPVIFFKITGKALDFDIGKIKAYYSFNNPIWIEMPVASPQNSDSNFFVLEKCEYEPAASRYSCYFYWRQTEWLCWSGGMFGNGCNDILGGFGMPFDIKFEHDNGAFFEKNIRDCEAYDNMAANTNYTILNAQMPTGEKFCKNGFGQDVPTVEEKDFKGPGSFGWCQYGMKLDSSGHCIVDDDREEITDGLKRYVGIKKCPDGQQNEAKQLNMELPPAASVGDLFIMMALNKELENGDTIDPALKENILSVISKADPVRFLFKSFVTSKGKIEKYMEIFESMDRCKASPFQKFAPIKDMFAVGPDILEAQTAFENQLICQQKEFHVYDDGECLLKCPEGTVKSADKTTCVDKADDECAAKGPSWEYNASSNSCSCKYEGADPNNNCACPAGTSQRYSAGKFVCMADGAIECTSDADCDNGNICRDNKCEEPSDRNKGFGESCSSSNECDPSKGLACPNGACVCDMDKGYVINQLTGNSCAFDKSIMDKCYDGEMIGSKCVTNADEAACLKAGKTWKNNECISGDTPSSGSGCGNIAGSSVPESVSSIMPYLLLLAGLACRRKGRNV